MFYKIAYIKGSDVSAFTCFTEQKNSTVILFHIYFKVKI